MKSQPIPPGGFSTVRPSNEESSLESVPGAVAPSPCILCGTDFSGSAAEAIDAAVALSIHRREKLLLVHSIAETFREQLPDEARAALIPEMEGRLHAEAERARHLGASVDAAVLPGWPGDGINERADRVHASLIVFGCPEFGALNRWLRGSVAEVIAESSSVPTLIVHSAAPFEKWVRGERPLRVLVTTDLTLSSTAALRWVAELRAELPCEITVGYIELLAEGNHRPELEAFTSLSLPVAQPSSPNSHDRWGRNRQVAGDAPTIRVVPRSAHVDEDLIRLAGEISADLLVVGTHQRHGLDRFWHRSVSREVLRHAPISVACIPDETTSASGGKTIHPS